MKALGERPADPARARDFPGSVHRNLWFRGKGGAGYRNAKAPRAGRSPTRKALLLAYLGACAAWLAGALKYPLAGALVLGLTVLRLGSRRSSHGPTQAQRSPSERGPSLLALAALEGPPGQVAGKGGLGLSEPLVPKVSGRARSPVGRSERGPGGALRPSPKGPPRPSDEVQLRRPKRFFWS